MRRFLFGSGLIYAFIIAFILEILIITVFKFKLRGILLLNFGVLIVLGALIIKAYKEAKLYLEKIEIDNGKISLFIYEYDTRLPLVIIPADQIDARLSHDYQAKYRRNKLEIRMKDPEKESTYNLIYRQYPIGYWNEEELEKAHLLIHRESSIYHV